MANAGGIRAGRAYVEVGADQSSLERALKSAEKSLKAWGAGISSIGRTIAKAGAAITAPFLVAAKRFADVGSDLNDMSARTGVSVEALSALGHAAEQTGTDMETVEGGIRKMQKALVAGSEENIQAEATFAALGLSVKRLERLSPETQFEILAKAIGNIQNPTAKAGAAMQVFGKSGTALLPMIDDLAALTKEAKDFGLVWSGDEAKKADALGDALDLLKASLGRVVTAVGSALAPLLTEIATEIARMVKRVIEWVQANGPLIETVFKAGIAILALGAALTAVGLTIAAVGAGLGVIATVVGLLLNPITLVVAALAGLTTWFLTSTETGGKALEWLGTKFHELTADAVAAFGGIAKALKAGNIALAGQILWAELKLEWVKGTNAIKALWSDWSGAILEVYHTLSGALASLMISGWAGMKAAWENGTNAIMKVAADVWGAIKDGWNSVWKALGGTFDGWVSRISKGMVDLIAEVKTQMALTKGYLTLSSSSKRIAEINKEATDRKAKIDKDTADRATTRETGAKDSTDADAKAAKKREDDHQKALANIGKAEMDAQATLTENQGTGVEARKKAREDALAGDAAALDAAKANLAGLLDKANALPEGQAVAPRGPKGAEEFTPDAIDRHLEGSKRKAEAGGDFMASAFRGLGIGKDIAGEQVAEQKQTNKHLEQLNKKAAQGRLVFQ